MASFRWSTKSQACLLHQVRILNLRQGLRGVLSGKNGNSCCKNQWYAYTFPTLLFSHIFPTLFPLSSHTFHTLFTLFSHSFRSLFSHISHIFPTLFPLFSHSFPAHSFPTHFPLFSHSVRFLTKVRPQFFPVV